MLASLFRGPVTYVPRSGWPGWAVLLGAAGIFVLAGIIGTLAGVGYYALTGGEVAQQDSTGLPVPQMPFAVGLAVLQICTILLTIAAAGLYQGERKAVLALVPPSDGWRILPWAPSTIRRLRGVDSHCALSAAGSLHQRHEANSTAYSK